MAQKVFVSRVQLIIAIVTTILLTSFVGLLAFWVVHRTTTLEDEETRPLLPKPEIKVVKRDVGAAYAGDGTMDSLDEDESAVAPSRQAPSPFSKVSEPARRVSAATASTEQGADVDILKTGTDEVSSSVPGPGHPMMRGRSRESSNKIIPASKDGSLKESRFMPGVSASSTVPRIDGTLNSTDTTRIYFDEAHQPASKGFLDIFLPPQGLVKAMKAKLKGPMMDNDVNTGRKDSITHEATPDPTHKETRSVGPHESQPCGDRKGKDKEIGDSAATMTDVAPPSHPPGAFPTSPPGAAVPQPAIVNGPAAKRKRKMTATRLSKPSGHGSKEEENTPAHLVDAGARPGSGSLGKNHAGRRKTSAQVEARSSSAPANHENSQRNPGSNHARSQRKRHTHKKAQSDAAHRAGGLAGVQGGET